MKKTKNHLVLVEKVNKTQCKWIIKGSEHDDDLNSLLFLLPVSANISFSKNVLNHFFIYKKKSLKTLHFSNQII